MWGLPIPFLERVMQVLTSKEVGWIVPTWCPESALEAPLKRPDGAQGRMVGVSEGQQQRSACQTPNGQGGDTGGEIAAAEFEKRGLTGGTDMWATANYSTEQILAAFRAFDARRAKEPIENPPGLLRTILEGGVAGPLAKAAAPIVAKPMRVKTKAEEDAAEAKAEALIQADNELRKKRKEQFPDPPPAIKPPPKPKTETVQTAAPVQNVKWVPCLWSGTGVCPTCGLNHGRFVPERGYCRPMFKMIDGQNQGVKEDFVKELGGAA